MKKEALLKKRFLYSLYDICFLTACHPLFKPKHTIRELIIHFMIRIGLIGIRMMAVEELHNMKTTPINVKMNIPFLEIGRDGFPDCHLGMQPLHCTPRGITNSFAVNLR